MRRPFTVWLTFAICLLAVTAAVGWMTLSAGQSEQARDRALFDSEISNALWRMDSLVAPLLAVEMTRPSFAAPQKHAPLLAGQLVNGYVVRDPRGVWTIRRDGSSPELQPVKPPSFLTQQDWEKTLQQSIPLWQSTPGEPQADSSSDSQLSRLITWPQVATTEPAAPNAKNLQGPVFNQAKSANQATQDRRQLVQQFSNSASIGQQIQNVMPTPSDVVPSHAVWIGNELVLARRVTVARSVNPQIELCWLNWSEWHSLLQAQLNGVTDRVELVPMADASQAASFKWRMASLPVGLQIRGPRELSSWSTPLVLVWTLLVVAAMAMGWVIRQTLDLSERRAAFVSAVTHELRTPLTTFRLYTEMLVDGVVKDAHQQQSYFQTLHREANRLMHLVENVLAYARLEYGRPTARHERVSLQGLFDRLLPCLEQRSAEAGLSLQTRLPTAADSCWLTTNAVSIEQVLFNLVDNCCKYAQSATERRIVCEASVQQTSVTIRVADFGPGLSAAARRSLFQPFQKSSSDAAESAAGIGLGLALSKRLAEDLGGSLRCGDNHPSGVWFELTLPTNTNGTHGTGL